MYAVTKKSKVHLNIYLIIFVSTKQKKSKGKIIYESKLSIYVIIYVEILS
jgi:uncharacterized protein YlbG (UPF0298 family)